MKVITLPSWRQLEGTLDSIRAELTEWSKGWHLQVLYRGQGNAAWTLTTTLERYLPPGRQVFSYLAEIENALRAISAHTGRTFSENAFAEFRDAESQVRNFGDPLPHPNVPLLSYMIYLRQFGFPSPLLDWTESPWIATYFAIRHQSAGASNAAVYVLARMSRTEPIGTGPQLVFVGPNIPTDKRHFVQQAQYTMSIAPATPTAHWAFAPHDDALSDPANPCVAAWKIAFPVQDRRDALDYLETFNLNAYALFATEEAFMEAVAHRYLGRLR